LNTTNGVPDGGAVAQEKLNIVPVVCATDVVTKVLELAFAVLKINDATALLAEFPVNTTLEDETGGNNPLGNTIVTLELADVVALPPNVIVVEEPDTVEENVSVTLVTDAVKVTEGNATSVSGVVAIEPSAFGAPAGPAMKADDAVKFNTVLATVLKDDAVYTTVTAAVSVTCCSPFAAAALPLVVVTKVLVFTDPPYEVENGH